MIGTVYVEREVVEHPRTREILGRLPRAVMVECERYGEVFNRRAQNFRLQKKRPALILAQKHGQRVLPTPVGYGIGGVHNFYFSHMLNCLYDCRYCFLQGMYRSAHWVVFVNYEDFFADVARQASAVPLGASAGEKSYFFSGYDGDSLAFDAVTGFVGSALSAFDGIPGAVLELRTKSARIAPLLEREPREDVVVAFSFTPEEMSGALEHGVPTVERRLGAMARLRERGWRLGLRFDPLIYCEDWEARYRRLFEQVFTVVDGADVHSVSLGPFRLPTGFFRTVERLYPEERLFAGSFEERGGMVSYPRGIEAEMVDFCARELSRFVPAERFHPCSPEG